MIGGFSSKRKTVKVTTLRSEVDTRVKSAFCEDRVRCNLMKVGSEMRESCDLLKHLNRRRDLTGSKESKSGMCSLGMNFGDAMIGRRDGDRRLMMGFLLQMFGEFESRTQKVESLPFLRLSKVLIMNSKKALVGSLMRLCNVASCIKGHNTLRAFCTDVGANAERLGFKAGKYLQRYL